MSAREQFEEKWVNNDFRGLDQEFFRAWGRIFYECGWEDGIKTWIRDTGKVMDDLKARIKELEALIPAPEKMGEEGQP